MVVKGPINQHNSSESGTDESNDQSDQSDNH